MKMYKVCARSGRCTVHWASLEPFAMDTCYPVSIFVNGFIAFIKTCRWVLGAPTCSFVIVALSSYCSRSFCISNVRCFSLRSLVYSTKDMARCCPLSDIAVTNIAEAENPTATDHLEETSHIISEGEAPRVLNDDGHALSAGGTDESADGGASNDENS
jgi:hypothetical protein